MRAISTNHLYHHRRRRRRHRHYHHHHRHLPLHYHQYVIATSTVVITVTAVTSTLRSTSFSSLLIFPPSATVEEERGGHRRGGYLRVLRPENRIAQTLVYFGSRHALAAPASPSNTARISATIYTNIYWWSEREREKKGKGWLFGVISLFSVVGPSPSGNHRRARDV